VIDGVEADVLAVDLERHEHHLYVDELPVLPDATGDPVAEVPGNAPTFAPRVI